MRDLTWRPLVAAVALGLLSVVVGLRPPDALMMGLVVFVITLAWATIDSGDEYAWPEARLEEAAGTRREIAALTWSFVGRDGRVAEPAVRRLRVVTARRLLRHGVVLPDGIVHRAVAGSAGPAVAPEAEERARELLGERAWRTLTGPGGWLPSLADVAHCVDAIERLGRDATPRQRPPEPDVTPPRSTPEPTNHPIERSTP